VEQRRRHSELLRRDGDVKTSWVRGGSSGGPGAAAAELLTLLLGDPLRDGSPTEHHTPPHPESWRPFAAVAQPAEGIDAPAGNLCDLREQQQVVGARGCVAAHKYLRCH
jgi:hypothetical protein